MENMSLLDRFANPEILEQMTFGEKLAASSYVALLGMLVTFVALMIIWGLILTMTKLVGESKPKKEEVKLAKAPTPKVAVEKVSEDEEELIAVITAAVAASLSTSTHNIVVKNIVRIPDATPAWGRAGRIEQMSRMM